MTCKMIHQILDEGVRNLGLELSDAQQQSFIQYSQQLVDWNQRINLTRIISPDEIAIKHFLDSLSIVLVLPKLPANQNVIDVGSGAGFPGLPLKIVWPEIQITLLEATSKKTKFLQHVVEGLSLSGVTILTARAEEAGHWANHREQYDMAVARAVSKLATLVEYMLPLVRIGGLVVAQKGQHPDEEIDLARNAVQVLGGRITQILPVEVPGLGAERHLITIEKITATPKQYPRRAGLPTKMPI